MEWLISLYIGATIFGAGVTLLDILGFLGEKSDEGEIEAEVETGEESESESLLSPDTQKRKNVLLRFFSFIRNGVYFSLGFGPIGWLAVQQGLSPFKSLIWSVPAGLVIMLAVRILKSFMKQELDSQIRDEDLLMEKGKVIVTIGMGEMGKVRIEVNGTYVDRYARCSDPEEIIPVGEPVRVAEITRECVYVDRI
jgi:membrane protein implicated in regulation of membrane protease activity